MKSWKNDYLNRGDAGLSPGSLGPDSLWTVEREGEKIKLKSSKGDYLNRASKGNQKVGQL